MPLDFIRVLGKDPYYTNRPLYQWIPAHQVVKVYPIFGVWSDDSKSFWRTVADDENAVIVSYRLVLANGDEYSCGMADELAKLGIEVSPNTRRPIGYQTNDRATDPAQMLDPVENANEQEVTIKVIRTNE